MDDGVGTPSPPFGSFFTPLLISLAGIVSTSFAIVAYHLILARYCLRRRRRNAGSRWPEQGPIPNAQLPTGVEEKILNAIPILSYSTRNAKTFRVDQTECVVCLGELEDDEMVRLLPNCRHAFHVPCIDKWLSAHTSCPICRSPVVAEPETSGVPSSGIEIGEEEEESGDGCSCVQSGRLLRHCVSLVLPMEGKRRYLVTGLRRSLSMDQSYVINVQIEHDKEATTTSSNWCSKDVVTWSSRSYKVSSMKQLDRMSSMLLRSFSQLRINGQSSTARGILPY